MNAFRTRVTTAALGLFTACAVHAESYNSPITITPESTALLYFKLSEDKPTIKLFDMQLRTDSDLATWPTLQVYKRTRDVFIRKEKEAEFNVNATARIKQASKENEYITIIQVHISEYDFDNKHFIFSFPSANERYGLLAKRIADYPEIDPYVILPSVSIRYVPANIDEAKKIEHFRSTVQRQHPQKRSYARLLLKPENATADVKYKKAFEKVYFKLTSLDILIPAPYRPAMLQDKALLTMNIGSE